MSNKSDLGKPYESRYRWVMLILVWMIYCSVGIIQKEVAPLVTPLMTDLNLGYEQMGIILGSWQVTYVVAALIVGLVLDRYSLRRLIGIGTLVLALSGLLRTLAVDYETLLIPITIFGVSSPTISIGGPKLISVWFKGKDRKSAIGLYSTGPSIGGIVALSLTNSIIMPWLNSWRMTFAFFAGLVVAMSALWWAFAKEAGPTAFDLPRRDTLSFKEAVLKLVRIRNVGIVVLVGVSYFVVVHGLTNWLPKMIEVAGKTPEQAGYYASIPSVAGIFGVFLIPRWTPELKLKQVGALLLGISSISIYIIGTTTGVPLLIALLTQGMANGALLPICLLLLMRTEGVGSTLMGAAGGLFFTIGEIGGFAGPYIVGRLVDLTGSFYSSILFLTIIPLIVITPLMFVKQSKGQI